MKKNEYLSNFSDLVLIALLLCFSTVTSAQAQPKSFFEGKTITFLVGSSVGGGTDLSARLIARYLEKYIPGHPNVLINNVPGAAGMIAVNQLYNLSKPDGLHWSTMNAGSIFGVALGNDALKFELNKFIWIGQALEEAQVLYVKSATPYTSFEAIKTANKEGKRPKMGAQGRDHNSNFVVKVVEQILGVEIQVIVGYPGTAQILLDIDRALSTADLREPVRCCPPGGSGSTKVT